MVGVMEGLMEGVRESVIGFSFLYVLFRFFSAFSTRFL